MGDSDVPFSTKTPGHQGRSSKHSVSSTQGNSIHESLPREFSKEDVLDKYKVEKVLGTGSMVRRGLPSFTGSFVLGFVCVSRL